MYAACVTRNRMCLHVNDIQPGDCNVPMQRTVGTRLVITLGITTTLLSDSKLGQRMFNRKTAKMNAEFNSLFLQQYNLAIVDKNNSLKYLHFSLHKTESRRHLGKFLLFSFSWDFFCVSLIWVCLTVV